MAMHGGPQRGSRQLDHTSPRITTNKILVRFDLIIFVCKNDLVLSLANEKYHLSLVLPTWNIKKEPFTTFKG